ncbi:hypothetical protein CDL12_23704 [Handroanthus impetiginosus]|uniref:Uncharacterized protein n=1 Tax=Handroanthus impetiginosus TaxID=429701 RepID=A0A2G9GEQ3_9LAMI|nr:hypothetical protein CDL12_23704 [Handroanthus impetiginosus]
MENVGQHEVPVEYAPTLTRIFAKHGDIASNSYFPQYNTFLLMLVGLVVQKLQTNNFGYVLSKLDNMKNIVRFAKSGNLNVSWLLKHLAEIEEIRTLTTMAATREFDARKKIMMTAKKTVQGSTKALR